MKRQWRPALGVMVGLCATGAMAQDVPIVGNQRQSDLGLQLSLIHDSNISRSDPTIAAQRGIRPSDYTLRPEATVAIVQPIGRQAIFLNGFAGYDFHQRNKRLDRARVDMDGGGVISIGGCQATLAGGYAYLQNDLADITGATVENQQEIVDETAALSCGGRVGFGGQVVLQRQNLKNSVAQQTGSDHTYKSISGIGTYGNPRLGTFSLIYSYADASFPNRLTPTGGFGDGFRSTTFGGGYERKLGSKINIGGSLAKTMIKRESATVGTPLKANATTYSGELTYKFSRLLDLSLLASREVTPSNRLGKLYDVATSGEAAVNYKLGSRFLLTGGAQLVDSKSNTDTAPIFGPVLTKARTEVVYGAVRYRQSRRASLLFEARHEDRTTNLPIFDYTNMRVTLRAEVSF